MTGIVQSSVDSSESTLGLQVRGIRVAFGGNIALSNVDLAAPLGQITGLIGPNGAGKSTLFNACNGLLRPAGGTVSLFGVDITHRSPAYRARLGLGRSFQRVEVCNALTMRANIALGREARLVGVNPIRQVLAGSGQRQDIREATDEALAVCGIEDLAERSAAGLTTGQRRLLEIARVIAGGFRVLLLDEPSSGLDEDETERLGQVLTRVLRTRRLGILLVEHDIGFVMQACEHIYVLESGEIIFQGSPSEVQASSLVRAAYLGEEAGLEGSA